MYCKKDIWTIFIYRYIVFQKEGNWKGHFKVECAIFIIFYLFQGFCISGGQGGGVGTPCYPGERWRWVRCLQKKNDAGLQIQTEPFGKDFEIAFANVGNLYFIIYNFWKLLVLKFIPIIFNLYCSFHQNNPRRPYYWFWKVWKSEMMEGTEYYYITCGLFAKQWYREICWMSVYIPCVWNWP